MAGAQDKANGGRPRWDSVKSHVNRLRAIARAARRDKSYQAAAACEIAVGRALGVQPASPVFAGKGPDAWSPKVRKAAETQAPSSPSVEGMLQELDNDLAMLELGPHQHHTPIGRQPERRVA